ncbi:MAG: DUF192 domain-containing protein [Anaerolineae bacterium]|mgnify:CR=1 FL=1|jgi:uncharacterized membrane protein (UPF0127 family)
MKQVRVINESRGVTLAEVAGVADNMWTRLRGLIGRPPLQEGQGLIIRPSTGIHTFFMGYPIDALYVDSGGQVVRCLENVRPYRFAPVSPKCRMVVELPAGTIKRTGTAVGHRIATG